MRIAAEQTEKPAQNVPKEDLIYRKVAIDEIRKCRFVVDAIEKIRALPSAEPERKTGKWIFGHTLGHSWMKCSECLVSQDGQTACFSYCPNCGADMRGYSDE